MNEVVVRALTAALGDTPGIVTFFASYLGWLLFIVYPFVLVWRPREKWREEIIFVFTVVLTAWVASAAIKFFYASPRPFLELDNYTPLMKYGVVCLLGKLSSGKGETLPIMVIHDGIAIKLI